VDDVVDREGQLVAEETSPQLFRNQLTLTVDNVIDELYVNGEPITGSLENRRNWTVVDVVDNLELHNGHNVIAIKARDTGGPAALLAELDLDGDLHVSDETWKVTTSTPPSDWMETDFDDSDWPAATVHAAYGSESWGTRVDGISDDSAANWIWSSDREGDDVVYFRYRIPAGGPWKVRVADSNSEIRDLSTAEAVMDAFIAADAADGTDDFSQTADVINFFTIDGGTKGQYEDDVPFPGQPNPPTTFALQVTGTVLIESAGNYTFGFNVDDGARLDITKDGVVTTIVQQGGTQPPVTRLGHIYLEPGTYELELLYYNNRGSGALELFAAKGVHSSWNASDFKLLLPEDHLDRINATEADTDVCFDDAAGLESGRTGNSITQTWSNLALAGGVDAFFAHIQTYDGRDTAVVRARNVESSPQIKIEEEKSRDSEVNHATEVVGYLTVDTSGSREIRDTDNVLIGYAGPTLSLDHTWTTVSLPHRFTNPVVIAYLRSTPNGEGVHTRLRNVGATSFEVQIEDWAYQSFAPSGEVDYIVLEQGAHLLRDAQILQVGTETVTQEVQDVFTDVVFPLAFDAPPVVLSATQTRNGSDPMVTRHQSISTTGFSVLVEEEEARDNIHISETIGWVALSGDIDPISGSSCP
ncbi:MAG: PA14 domain-containing protein, partial [Acidobacteriota bacterium]